MNARNLTKLANAFAAAEAKATAQGRSTDPQEQSIAEWARKHRQRIEARTATPQRDPLTLSMFPEEASQ